MNRAEHRRHLGEKVQRQKAFFASPEPGLLAYVYRTVQANQNRDPDNLANKEGLAGYIYRAIATKDGSIVPDEARVEAVVEKFVLEHRKAAADAKSPPPGDALPCVYPHWDIGWHTAAMTGLAPSFSGGSWWLEPNLDWQAIDELRFDPDNPWLVTARHAHRALQKFWDEDYWTMPLIHRSPLDYANGIRGTQLFIEILTEVDRVKRLLDWCVDWQLKAEAFVYEGIDVPSGWGTGVMETWAPDRAVWVNGDPVGLISREMMLEFEQPYTGRLFTSTGGGMFHNHTLGLYQADQVAATPGIHMQNFSRDPNRPTVEQTLLQSSAARDRILRASLQTPILISGMTPESLRSVLPIVSDGRFMLNVGCGKNDDLDEIVRSIRRA